MLKPLSVLAVSSFASLALSTMTVPTAVAESFCGTSSRGASVYAGNDHTSCGFALAVAEAYHSRGNGSDPFRVKSPKTSDTYTMVCENAGTVCRGGNDAVVYLRG
jgi:hypothetical protein